MRRELISGNAVAPGRTENEMATEGRKRHELRGNGVGHDKTYKKVAVEGDITYLCYPSTLSERAEGKL